MRLDFIGPATAAGVFVYGLAQLVANHPGVAVPAIAILAVFAIGLLGD